ncbi:MAG TPA: hypothetical protein VFF40_00855 [Acidimicrobiia bacterium]|nr:hypothetical protein [Acidimicrobiia bacterium]
MEGTSTFDTELDAQLLATALRWVGPLLGVAALLAAAALAAELLERAGRARRTSALLRYITPRVFRRLTALMFVAAPLLQPTGDGEAPVRDWLANTTTTTAPAGPPTSSGRVEAAPASPAPPPDPEPTAPAEAPAPDPYIVQSGDCLWTIAEHRLPPGATNLAIDAAWRRVYAANATAIGTDPNLIMVGLVLELPPLDTP